MEAHELIHAALEWAKDVGYAQRAREEAVERVANISLDSIAKSEAERLCKYLDAAKRRIDELTKERDGVLRYNDELANDLNAAKDARIIAEKEANDLRAWLRGLVKPGNMGRRPKDYVLQLKDGSIIFKGNGDSYTIDSTQRWFDPLEIFEAADRDNKEEE